MKSSALQGSIWTVQAVRCKFGLDFKYSTVQKGSGTVLVGCDVVKVLPENRRILVSWLLEKAILLVRVIKSCFKSNHMSVYCIRGLNGSQKHVHIKHRACLY